MSDVMINPARTGHLKTWVDSWVVSQSIPGAMIGIYGSQGEELFFYGNDNMTEGSQRYTRDALFRIYSMTKPMTSVAVLILAERGILSVHDEVAKWIPSFASMQVLVGGTVDEPITEPLKTPLTLHHLLSHTSGLSYGIFGNNVCDQLLKKVFGIADIATWYHYVDLATLADKIAQVPLCLI